MQNKNHKIRVGLLFGGKSTEHEVSIQSAMNIYHAIDRTKYEPVLISIDKDGNWQMADEASFEKQQIIPRTDLAHAMTALFSDKSPSIDVVFPILHGPLGEDGTVQGLLELANMPYVGPGVLGSAIGMDKDVMKRLLCDADLPIAGYQTFRKHQQKDINYTTILKDLGDTVFVKPANMGSSVGVSRAKSVAELKKAMTAAFQFDTKVIVEAAVIGKEIECAVLGNESPKASPIGEITPRDGDFYSYDAKYVDEHGATLTIPAALSPDVMKRAQEIAIQAFQVLECAGMSRVDMFVTPENEVIINEINTIPGFTKISMYPKLWEQGGVSYTDLISQLIELAIARWKERQSLHTHYEGHL